jgi:hypothetical protein
MTVDHRARADARVAGIVPRWSPLDLPLTVHDRLELRPVRRHKEYRVTKHSRFEREKRARETERAFAIQAAWVDSVPREVAQAFTREVEAARARGPLPRPPDMAPGTPPRPPRPGREPKAKEERTTKRRSY